MKKNILLTGGAGFVGSSLALYVQKRWKGCRVICFDNLIRKGSSLNVQRLKDNGIQFIRGDIRDKKKLFSLPKIDCLAECSAEPSVTAAYHDPNYTVETNLFGTVNCLELARRDKADFIFLSSSRIYPIEPMNDIPFTESATRYDWKKTAKGLGYSHQGIRENFPLDGVRSLYGATKLCSEHIAQEYFAMFGIKGVVNRIGVIAGPWQMGRVDQGVVGFWTARHKFGGKLSYIGYGGSGKQLRDAVHIDDVCGLIFYQMRNISKVHGKIFNAGGGRRNTFSLYELTGLVQRITGSRIPIAEFAEERKSDVRIYITDNSAVKAVIGWSPKRNLEDIVRDVNFWIDAHKSKLAPILR